MFFKRVIAYPNGTVVYDYYDKILTYKKDMPPHIQTKTYNKDIDGLYTFDWDLLSSSVRS